ncbi:hypothetical protein AAEO56_06710 [Flavobacterium sp. DGU11]|uniref:Uncharacterized protein n=1 Tax=Flavobacterium arundinis TaxID=3139143 RepID=A0ABU9HUW3_9FLAO
MIEKLLLLIIIMLFTSFTSDKDVYICQSKNAKRYHFTKDCKGLSNCKAEIGKVTLSEAEKQGKTVCGYED